MMNVHTVFIQDSHWWIDSLWIEKASADRRIADLKNVLDALGNTATRVWTRQLRIEDAALAPPEKATKNQ